MADIEESNDQNSLSAEEQAQMTEMEAADKGAPSETVAPAPASKKPKAPAAAAAAPKEDAPAEGADGAEAEGEKKGKGGPLTAEALAAVREERAEKKALRDELAAERANTAKVIERFEKVLERLTPKEEAVKEPELPNRDEDPVGYIEAVMKKTGESLEQVSKRLDAADQEKAQATQQRQNQDVIGNIITQATVKEREFLATTPDYNDASAFMLQSRKDELTELGYTDTEQNAIIMQEKVSIAAKALADGKNPAAVIYGLAKRRGYAPKVAADDADEDGEEESVVAKPAPAAVAERLKNVEKGQEASASLSNLGGKGPTNLTAQRLAEMTDAEFAAAMETKEGRALMGA